MEQVNEAWIWQAVFVMALANLLTRAAPFLFFSRHRPPRLVIFIEQNFPPVILTILILYTLSGVDLTQAPYGIRELLGIAVTVLLHWRWRNYLVSIFGGTAFYMVLVQGG
ncbi:branched-chain amino acid transporter permease [Nitratifractor salsuginis]|uniref:Branched-chain amino acid transport n=1 Tax=Nitratifractor salsuginis (strain DSM 16511 / JCM 12458 / E9I37-1) TaxID=749222 RepID=E6X1T9_NITSE|nr:AzlD domain-containing protein [Nitratifractor salsuginis]ADV45947.1 branched-chain amino acid transport [Nitratifractor salsuginis DSM 16511]